MESQHLCVRCNKLFDPSISDSETGKFCQSCVKAINEEEEKERQSKLSESERDIRRTTGFSLSLNDLDNLRAIRFMTHSKNLSATLRMLIDDYMEKAKSEKKKNDKPKKT